MKQLLFILFFVIYLNTLTSQTSLEAKNLLNEVSQQISSFKNIYFDFTYVLDNKQEQIRQETSGNVIVSGELYKLKFLGATQLFDGEKTYTIVPENEEITITDLEEQDDLGLNPSKLLTFYESGYDYHLDITQKHSGKTIQFIKLIPSEENLDIKYLLLGIDVNSKNIFRLIEIGSNGTRTTLTIKNQKENLNLKKSFFVFNTLDYPDFYINK
jgi:outer membrane lipoprotein-sorting protein